MPDDLRDQFPIVREIIAAFGIPIYQLEGFEADDLIATLVRQAEDARIETTIVSGDLDLLQIVSDQTTLMTTRGGVQQTVFYDPAKVMERYGLRARADGRLQGAQGRHDGQHPGHRRRRREDRRQAASRTGARSTGIYEHIDEVMPEKLRVKLEENRDDVLRWRELVTVGRTCPSSSTSSRPGWATTTGTRSCASSASTSSARSSSGCRA